MSQSIRLLVALYQGTDYGGQVRFVHKDVYNIDTELGFNDRASSVIVYKGPHYREGDIVRLYQHPNKKGGYIDLEPGYYRNIHVVPFSLGDRVSSIDFLPPQYKPQASPIRLIIRVFQHKNYGGQERTIFYNENNLSDIGLNDRISSLIIERGPDYRDEVVDFFEHTNYTGGKLAPGTFGPGTEIPDLHASPYRFGDRISSILIRRKTSKEVASELVRKTAASVN